VALTVLLGGARSGKSHLALSLATDARAPVTFVATGEALDAEMADRIRRHREERPEGWTVVEEPYLLGEALVAADPRHTVIVDCLTLWVANALERDGDAGTVLDAARSTARTAATREASTIAITNEVGLGIVPATPLGRTYRDLLGSVNSAWVAESEAAFLVVAGRTLALDGPSSS
jgi:adenosylcobinamide kinase / adenosylcobinamide-phosphate guanylyltransferase